MTIRTARLGAALFATIALVACAKPADKPLTDTTAAANATPTVATPTVATPTDSATAANAAQLKSDSTKPTADSTKPAAKK